MHTMVDTPARPGGALLPFIEILPIDTTTQETTNLKPTKNALKKAAEEAAKAEAKAKKI